MGYFDAVEEKKDVVQEMGQVERQAGNAFWFSIGGLGFLLYGFVFNLLFEWKVLYVGFFLLIAMGLCVVGLVLAIKAKGSAALVREKTPLGNVALAYSLLWFLLSALVLVVNCYNSIQAIIANL